PTRDLLAEVLPIDLDRGRFRVLFWIASNTNSKIWIVLFDQGDEVGRVGQPVRRWAKGLLVLRWIAAERHDVLHASIGGPGAPFEPFASAGADAGKVRRRGKINPALNRAAPLDRASTRPSSRPIRT